MSPKDFINVPLLTHPVNWLVVWTVLIFGAFAWHFVHERISARPISTG